MESPSLSPRCPQPPSHAGSLSPARSRGLPALSHPSRHPHLLRFLRPDFFFFFFPRAGGGARCLSHEGLRNQTQHTDGAQTLRWGHSLLSPPPGHAGQRARASASSPSNE